MTGIDKNKYNLKLICRFPITLRTKLFTYILIEVVDNDGVEAMVDVVFDNQGVKKVDLYVSEEVRSNNIGGSNESWLDGGSYSFLLS